MSALKFAHASTKVKSSQVKPPLLAAGAQSIGYRMVVV